MSHGPFDPKFIQKQKMALIGLRTQILNQIHHGQDELELPADQTREEAEHAQLSIELEMSFGLKERDLWRLREIEAALERIEKGEYGICEEYDRPIEQKRLEHMPWARLCVEAAEENERMNEKKKRAS